MANKHKSHIANWTATKAEMLLIEAIANRAFAMVASVPKINYKMDIEACHCNGNALDLQRLLQADNFNFSHDVFGIHRHINHTSGKLEDFFRPRFLKHKPNMSTRLKRNGLSIFRRYKGDGQPYYHTFQFQGKRTTYKLFQSAAESFAMARKIRERIKHTK